MYEQVFYKANGGGDVDGDYTVHLLIYYCLGNENNVERFDFIAIGNCTESVQDDVIAAIKEREHDDVTFYGSKRINIL